MRYSTASTRSARRHLITTRSSATLGGAASAMMALPGPGSSYGGHPRSRT